MQAAKKTNDRSNENFDELSLIHKIRGADGFVDHKILYLPSALMQPQILDENEVIEAFLANRNNSIARKHKIANQNKLEVVLMASYKTVMLPLTVISFALLTLLGFVIGLLAGTYNLFIDPRILFFLFICLLVLTITSIFALKKVMESTKDVLKRK